METKTKLPPSLPETPADGVVVPWVTTSATSIRETVARYWPRGRISDEQAEIVWAKLRDFGADDVLAAIKHHYTEHLSATRPNWDEIRAFLRQQARAMRAKDPDADGCGYIRAWWRLWADPKEAKKRPPPKWAVEILALYESAPERITPADWRNWNDAWLAYLDYGFYCLGNRWKSGHDDEVYQDAHGEDRLLRSRGRASRERALRYAHGVIRNLRTLGPETDRAREDWLRNLEMDARAGGVEVEAVEFAHEEDPF